MPVRGVWSNEAPPRPGRLRSRGRSGAASGLGEETGGAGHRLLVAENALVAGAFDHDEARRRMGVDEPLGVDDGGPEVGRIVLDEELGAGDIAVAAQDREELGPGVAFDTLRPMWRPKPSR